MKRAWLSIPSDAARRAARRVQDAAPSSPASAARRVTGLVLIPCLALAPAVARGEPPAAPAEARPVEVQPAEAQQPAGTNAGGPPAGEASIAPFEPEPAAPGEQRHLAEAERQIAAGDDEAALTTLTEAIERDPSSPEPYRRRAEVAGRLAVKHGPGSAFLKLKADDLGHVLALEPGRSDYNAKFSELQQAHLAAERAAKREERRRRLMPAAMTLGFSGAGVTLASATFLVLARTNVGNEHTETLMTRYSLSFLGVGLGLVTAAIVCGVLARQQYARDDQALRLTQPRYSRREGPLRWTARPQLAGGGVGFHFGWQ